MSKQQPPAKKPTLAHHGGGGGKAGEQRAEGGKRRKTVSAATSSPSTVAAHVQQHGREHAGTESLVSESERFALYVQRVQEMFPSDVPAVTTERTGERKQSRLNHSLATTRVPSTVAAVEAGRRWNAIKVPQDINDAGRDYQAYHALNDDRVKMRLQLNKAGSMGASAIAAMYRYSPFMLAEDLSLFSYDIKRERGIALNTNEFGGYTLYAETMMRFLCMYENNSCGFYPYRLGRSEDMPRDTYNVVCPFFQETKSGWYRAAQLLETKPLVPDEQLQHPERQNKYMSPTTYEVQKTLGLSAAKMCKAFRHLRNGIRYMVSYLNVQLRQPDSNHVIDFMRHWLTRNEQTIVAPMIPIKVVANAQMLTLETVEEIAARSERYMRLLNTYVEHGEVECGQPYYSSVSHAMGMSVGLLTYLTKNTPLPYFMRHVYEHIKRGFTAATLTLSVPVTHRIRWLSYSGTEMIIDETTNHQPNPAMMAARKKLNAMVNREVMHYVERVRDDPQRDSIVIEKKSAAMLRRYSGALAYEPPVPRVAAAAEEEEAAPVVVHGGKRARARVEEGEEAQALAQQAALKRRNIERQEAAAAAAVVEEAAEAEPRRRKTREETVVSSSSSAVSAASAAAAAARTEPPKKKPQKEQREKPAAMVQPPPLKKKTAVTPAATVAATVAPPPLQKQIVQGSKRMAASSVDVSSGELVPEVEGVEEQKSNVEKKKRKPLTEEEKQRIEQQRQRARMAAHQLMRQQMALQQQSPPLAQPLYPPQQLPPPVQYAQPPPPQQQQYLQPQPQQYTQLPPPPQQFGSLY